LEYNYNDDLDIDMDDVDERLPFLKEQWNKNFWIKGLADSRIDVLTSYTNRTWEEDNTIWSTGFSCTGPIDHVFYQVPDSNFTSGTEETLSTRDEYDMMKDLFEDYCTHISKDQEYEDVFGLKWWNDKNETIAERNKDLLDDEDFDPEDDVYIKNLDWYMPK